jgi:calpain-15
MSQNPQNNSQGYQYQYQAQSGGYSEPSSSYNTSQYTPGTSGLTSGTYSQYTPSQYTGYTGQNLTSGSAYGGITYSTAGNSYTPSYTTQGSYTASNLNQNSSNEHLKSSAPSLHTDTSGTYTNYTANQISGYTATNPTYGTTYSDISSYGGTNNYGGTTSYGGTYGGTSVRSTVASDPLTKAYTTDYVVRKGGVGGEQVKSSGAPQRISAALIDTNLSTHGNTYTGDGSPLTVSDNYYAGHTNFSTGVNTYQAGGTGLSNYDTTFSKAGTTVSTGETTTTSNTATAGQMMIGGKAYNSWEEYLALNYPGGVGSTTNTTTATSTATTGYTGSGYTTTMDYNNSYTGITSDYTSGYGTTTTSNSHSGEQVKKSGIQTTHSYTPASTTSYLADYSYTPSNYGGSTTTTTSHNQEAVKKSVSPTSKTSADQPSSPTKIYNKQTSAKIGGTISGSKTTNIIDIKPIKPEIAPKPLTDQKTHQFEIIKVKGDGGIQIEAKAFIDDPNSIFNQTKNKLKATGKKYSDQDFVADFDSLAGGMTEEELYDMHGDCGFEWNSLGWARPDTIYGKGNYQIFNDGISWNDIKQGSLGDCYYLSVLAALAEWPHRIEKLLVTKQVNDQCIYGVRICDMGEWKEVILDDYVPVFPDDGTPVFSSGNGNELWVMLLEKAWAKLYGSYAKIEAGLTREALHDLTSAPTKYYLTKELSEEETETLWHDILEAEKKNYCMTCGADDFGGDGHDDLDEELGIVASHAYSLLSANEVKTKTGKIERLVELRNPWGKSEWKGAWSDGSKEWTEQLKKQLKVHEADDGVFHMTYDDFLKYYSDVQICKIHDDYHYTSLKVNTTHKNAKLFKINVPRDGKYYISVNQQSKRHHKSGEDFQYSSVWLILGKQVGDKYEHLQGLFRADREVFTESHLTAGEYVLYVKIAWYDKAPRDFVLSSYGPDDVTFTKVSKSDIPNLVEKMYHHKGRNCNKLESYADLEQANCFRAVELTDEGYGYIYYQNKSKKILKEAIGFNVLDGLKLVKPYRGKQYDITVAPGEEKVVLLKCDPDSEGYRQSFSERATFS